MYGAWWPANAQFRLRETSWGMTPTLETVDVEDDVRREVCVFEELRNQVPLGVVRRDDAERVPPEVRVVVPNKVDDGVGLFCVLHSRPDWVNTEIIWTATHD